MIKVKLLFSISCLLRQSVMAQGAELTTNDSLVTSFLSIGAQLISALQSNYGMAIVTAIVGWIVVKLIFSQQGVGHREQVALESASEDKGKENMEEPHLSKARQHESNAETSRAAMLHVNAATNYLHAAEIYAKCGDQKKAKELTLQAGQQYALVAEKKSAKGDHEVAAVFYEFAANSYRDGGDQEKVKELSLLAGQQYVLTADKEAAGGKHLIAAVSCQLAANRYRKGGNQEKMKEANLLAGRQFALVGERDATKGMHKGAASNYQSATKCYQAGGDQEKAFEAAELAKSCMWADCPTPNHDLS